MKTPVSPLSGAVLAWCVLVGCSTHDLREVERPCSFSKPPYVHPKIVQDLMIWLSDHGDHVVAINVLDAQDSNRYFGEVEVREIEGEAPYVRADDGPGFFGYQYVGTLASGIDVLCTSDSGGGSGIFIDLLLVRWEEDQGIDCDWDDLVVRRGRRRLLLRKVGQFGLGDRWAGKLDVRGNEILVGKDMGHFSGRDVSGLLSADPKDRVLRVDLEPARCDSMRVAVGRRPAAPDRLGCPE